MVYKFEKHDNINGFSDFSTPKFKKKFFKKGLTNGEICGIILKRQKNGAKTSDETRMNLEN